MKILCAILSAIFGIISLILLAQAGYDYLSSTNELNQLLGTSQLYLETAIIEGGIGILFALSAIGCFKYAGKLNDD
jgi:TRAP-type C4-dicarboxylate transport system permease small subunit